MAMRSLWIILEAPLLGAVAAARHLPDFTPASIRDI